MSAVIHPSADVHPSAQLGENVRIDAGAMVGEGCVIGAGSAIGRSSLLWAGARIGANNRIFPFCSLGGEPQDKKYAGEETALVIGDNNTIREYCFINKGTAASGETRIGSGNWIMAYVHVAHDCIIGDNTIIANAAQLAGHVVIGDDAVIGGGALFHQFRRVGSGAMIGGGERLRQDVPPYATVACGAVAVNTEGMRRRGCEAEVIRDMRQAYKILYRQGHALAAAADKIAALPQAGSAPIARLLAFLRQPDVRLIRPQAASAADDSGSA